MGADIDAGAVVCIWNTCSIVFFFFFLSANKYMLGTRQTSKQSSTPIQPAVSKASALPVSSWNSTLRLLLNIYYLKALAGKQRTPILNIYLWLTQRDKRAILCRDSLNYILRLWNVAFSTSCIFIVFIVLFVKTLTQPKHHPECGNIFWKQSRSIWCKGCLTFHFIIWCADIESAKIAAHVRENIY